jgi:hypothetical protein
VFSLGVPKYFVIVGRGHAGAAETIDKAYPNFLTHRSDSRAEPKLKILTGTDLIAIEALFSKILMNAIECWDSGRGDGRRHEHFCVPYATLEVHQGRNSEVVD